MTTARTRIKICGLRTPEQALEAVAAGADGIGLVFHPDSPRAVEPAAAREICAALPAFVTSVGLFVDASPRRIGSILDEVPLQLLQFHGAEPAADCERWGRPYLKALRMRPGLEPSLAAADYASAAGILLDSYRPGVPGGTGERFDWARVAQQRAFSLVLAGGLDADNVAEAVVRVRPWAVDVSGGVERAPGIKDPERMVAFVRAVRRADAGADCCG